MIGKEANLLSMKVIGSLGKSTLSTTLGLNPNISKLNEELKWIKSIPNNLNSIMF